METFYEMFKKQNKPKYPKEGDSKWIKEFLNEGEVSCVSVGQDLI